MKNEAAAGDVQRDGQPHNDRIYMVHVYSSPRPIWIHHIRKIVDGFSVHAPA